MNENKPVSIDELEKSLFELKKNPDAKCFQCKKFPEIKTVYPKREAERTTIEMGCECGFKIFDGFAIYLGVKELIDSYDQWIKYMRWIRIGSSCQSQDPGHE